MVLTPSVSYSARVMRNENGDSRGFGFVSFQTPDQGLTSLSFLFALPSHPFPCPIANAAMHAMNGMQLGSKQIVVRLHEPKQLRQEKLAQRFGHNGHPRSASGATSPTVSEGGESYIGWSSPRQRTSALGSPVGSGGGYDHHHPHHHHRTDRGRRGSGSYYNVRGCFAVLPFCTCSRK
jgi:polyadenylate-binding protein